jgi:hypothetical protein
MDRSSRKRLRFVIYFIVAVASLHFMLNAFHVGLPENIVNSVKYWIKPELNYRNKHIGCSSQTLEAIKTIESDLYRLTKIDDEIEIMVKWNAYQTKLGKIQLYSESKSIYNIRDNPKSMTVKQFQTPNKSENPHVVIYAEKCSPLLNKLVESDYSRFNVTILGLNNVENDNCLVSLTEFTRLLETLNFEDIVIYTNFENIRLLPTCSIDQIMGLYHDLKTPLVFMGNEASKDNLNKTFHNLNAGVSMGKVWAYLDLLHDAISKDEIELYTNIQDFWKKHYQSNRKYIGVGHDRKLVPIVPDDKQDEIETYYNEIPKSYISVDFNQNLFMGNIGDVIVDSKSLFNNSVVVNGRITMHGGSRPCIFCSGFEDNFIFDNIDK